MLAFAFLLVAIILFIIAGIGVPNTGRYNLLAIGLAFFAGAELLDRWPQ